MKSFLPDECSGFLFKQTLRNFSLRHFKRYSLQFRIYRIKDQLLSFQKVFFNGFQDREISNGCKVLFHARLRPYVLMHFYA